MSTTSSTTLRAGAAKIEISPEKGIQIAGDIGRNRPCTGTREPIFARTLVVEKDGKKFCVISLDLLLVDDVWAPEIRRRTAKTYGIPFEAVMVHATQAHSAPSLGNHFCRDSSKLIPDKHPWLRGGDDRFNEPTVAKVLDAIGQSIQQLTPVTLAAGRGIDGRVGFNRRFVMRDGTSRCQPPLCSPDILHVEGPSDPEVGVATFTAADGRVVAALLHYTSHPCNGFFGNEAFPDWPGAWCREMDAHFGKNCVSMMINGLCGNIITYNYLNPEQPERGDYLNMGHQLAETAKKALETMSPVDPASFSWMNRVIQIPRRQIPAEVLEKSKKVLRDNPEPIWKDEIRVEWEWVYAVGIVDSADEQITQPNSAYELQALRIGNFVLMGMGGEPFVETQLRIKHDSPFKFTQIAHMCHGFVGYIPTKRGLEGGGYETWVGRTSRHAPEAAEMIENESIKLLKDLAKA